MTSWLVALLWAPLSVGLHTAAHEGAHAAMGAALGHPVERIELLPGRTYFAPGPWTDSDSALTLAAPLMLEAAYAPIALGLAANSEGALRAVLLVETAVSIGMLTVWCLGAWTRAPLSDGYRFEEATGAPARVFVVLPVGMAIGLLATVLGGNQ